MSIDLIDNQSSRLNWEPKEIDKINYPILSKSVYVRPIICLSKLIQILLAFKTI